MREQQSPQRADTEFSTTADYHADTSIDTLDGIHTAYLELQKKLKRGQKAENERTIRVALRGRENLLRAQSELAEWTEMAEKMLPLYAEMEKMGRLSAQDAARQKNIRLRLASVRDEQKDNNAYIKNSEKNPKVINRLHTHALREDQERTAAKYSEIKSKIIGRLSEVETDSSKQE